VARTSGAATNTRFSSAEGTYKATAKPEFDSESPVSTDMGRSWPGLLWRHAANRQTWTGSTFGHLLRVEPGERGRMLAWWGGLLLAWPEYAAAAHCRDTFLGETALVRSWVRAASRATAARGADRRAAAGLLRDSPQPVADRHLVNSA